MSRSFSAPEFYALGQGVLCEGDQECHYCAAPCSREYLHDDPPPTPFVRTITSARRPANPYLCRGCWMFRRKRITIEFLAGGYKDGQCPQNHSWWLTGDGAWALRPADYPTLYDRLFKPPLDFCLAFVSEGKTNAIQWAGVNCHKSVQADTPLSFTIDNTVYPFTVYELQEALKLGSEGKEPGVRALVSLLGPHEMEVEKKRGPGRPPARDDARVTRRVLTV